MDVSLAAGRARGPGRGGAEDRSPLTVWPESVPLGLREATLYPQEFRLSLGLPPDLVSGINPPAPFPATLFPGSADTAHVENAAAAPSAEGSKAVRSARKLLERDAAGSPAPGPDSDALKTRAGVLRFGT